MTGWRGDPAKIEMQSCPNCEMGNLNPLREAEDIHSTVFCSSCGFVGEYTITEHTSDLPAIDDSTTPPTIVGTDIEVAAVVE